MIGAFDMLLSDETANPWKKFKIGATKKDNTFAVNKLIRIFYGLFGLFRNFKIGYLRLLRKESKVWLILS